MQAASAFPVAARTTDAPCPMTQVLTVALPVFAVIAAGLAAGRLALLPANDIEALNRFVFRFAMPAALFGLTARADRLTVADLSPAIAYGVAAAAVMAASYWLARLVLRTSPQEAGAHALGSTFGNAVFLGLPIALSIDGWAQPYVVLMLIEGTFVIALGAALMAPRSAGDARPLRAIKEAILRPLRNPIIAAALAGFAWSIVGRRLGLELSGPAAAFFDLLGRAAGPAALFSLGLFLATPAPLAEGGRMGRILSIAIAKMVALPTLTLGGLWLIGGASTDALGAAALFTAVPTAIGAYVMATQYRVYVREIAASIAITSAISVASISIVLIVFN